MNNIINEINQSETFAKIIEIGAGLPVAEEFYKYAGASKTIYLVESPYAYEAFERKYGKCAHRAVSAERLKHINDYIQTKEELQNNYYNTILSSTFQVGGSRNEISTHGWYSLNINGKSKYYHMSLHEAMDRREYIKNIGETGIMLLHSKNETQFTNSFIDIVLNDDLSYDYETTLKFANLSDIEDYAIVFKQDGTIDRLESITRGTDNLILYKGSFNPPTLAHIEIAEAAENLHKTSVVFTISFNTFNKGHQDIKSIVERIKMINILGYDVLVVNRPLFKDTTSFIRNKFNGTIIYPMGVDTINRLANDYEESFDFIGLKSFVKHFNGVKFLCNLRDDYEFSEVSKKLIENGFVETDEIEHSYISSTMFRKGSYEEIEKYVPNKIKDFLKK